MLSFRSLVALLGVFPLAVFTSYITLMVVPIVVREVVPVIVREVVPAVVSAVVD